MVPICANDEPRLGSSVWVRGLLFVFSNPNECPFVSSWCFLGFCNPRVAFLAIAKPPRRHEGNRLGHTPSTVTSSEGCPFASSWWFLIVLVWAHERGPARQFASTRRAFGLRRALQRPEIRVEPVEDLADRASTRDAGVRVGPDQPSVEVPL